MESEMKKNSFLIFIKAEGDGKKQGINIHSQVK
jgi:hypothetical protein